jgi:NitT/TauT family transport system substrate-binding protein
VNELRITYQPSIIYLAVVVMRHEKLVEKAAADLGMPGFTTGYTIFGGGGAAIDALLSGRVDILTTGSTNMLLLWDRTKGGVKAYAQSAATPMWLISTNPKVQSLKDLSANDKIAVPTVKISSQAVLLQMAARKLYGDADFAHFDQFTTTLGHPDAVAALMSNSGALTGHFSAPPYEQDEAKLPGAKVLITSTEIMGGPVSNALYFGLAKFHDENPQVVKAFMIAARQAQDFIAAHPREACEMYAELSGDKTPVDELVKVIQAPGMLYNLTPVGMYATAEHMNITKVMKSLPKSWKDFMFPEAYDMPGN